MFGARGQIFGTVVKLWSVIGPNIYFLGSYLLLKKYFKHKKEESI